MPLERELVRTGREVNLSLSLGLHVAVERVANPIIKNPSEAAMNGVLWCILKQANPNPMGVIQQMLIEPNSHNRSSNDTTNAICWFPLLFTYHLDVTLCFNSLSFVFPKFFNLISRNALSPLR